MEIWVGVFPQMELKMPPGTYPAGLKLRVKELDRALTFYTGLLGLEQDGQNSQGTAPAGAPGSGGVRLSLNGGHFYLDLVEEVRAPLRPYPSVGLYHFALLLPERTSLGRVLRKLVKAGWEFEGAADHGVSEALYLRDPERNGIELYRDRPRESWRQVDGQIAMVTEPLDVLALLEETPEPGPLHPETRLGHMHLHVDDLGRALEFYGRAVGLETRASLPGAEFLAAGDYHHHLGLNTWAGTRRAGSDATGLLEYAWKVPPGAVEDVSRRFADEEVEFERANGTIFARDPIGVGVRFIGSGSTHP